jgi:serine/threonine protein phosphatase 1
LDDERDHGFVIVHGHTITEQVERSSNRIGIDTGAYKTGVLTVLGVEEADVWLLQTNRDSGVPERHIAQ